MMKFAVILCVFGLVYAEKAVMHFTPEIRSAMRAKGDSCAQKFDVESSALIELMSATLPDSPVNRQFAYCFSTEMGLADEDGHLKVANIVAMAPTDERKLEFEKVVTECNKKSGKDKYETTYLVHKCFHANAPVVFSLE